ncbi:hypothetical protein ABZ815_00010 [Nonomuraea sp. NPDC047529]|uniref:hypothetical protein n=1 Tax=Nonomuraea sp. NPDC047529 TaxID=3155623 RepID=UPI0033F2F118
MVWIAARLELVAWTDRRAHPEGMAQSSSASMHDHQTKITAVISTRHLRLLRWRGRGMVGRLDEIAFLDGLYDLDGPVAAPPPPATTRSVALLSEQLRGNRPSYR